MEHSILLRPFEKGENEVNKGPELYSQQFIFFIAYEWEQKVMLLGPNKPFQHHIM
jgi:hypothetical protein